MPFDSLAISLAAAAGLAVLLAAGLGAAWWTARRRLLRGRAQAAEHAMLLQQTQELAVELEQTIDELRVRTDEAERTADRLRAVQAVTDAALANLDLDTLLRELLRRVVDALRCDIAAILLRTDDGEHVVLRAAVGLDDEVQAARPIPLGRGIAGRVAESGRPEVVPDLSRVEVVLPALRERIRSLIAVPLVVEGRVIGVLDAGSETPRGFTPDDVELLRLVAERSAYALEHARLYGDALQASRAKSDFLANMSHELRTPVNAVTGYVELMQMGIPGPVTDAQRAYLDRIRASNDHLLALIDEVLDIARIESGRVQVARERVPLAEVVASALALVRPQALRKGITLDRACPGEGGPAFGGDAHRTRQIAANLLTNAVKFTDEGGRVRVACGRSDDADKDARLGASEAGWAWLRVEDTGIGIAPDHQERIFQPFVQVDATLTRTRGGTGLGLAISRRFARMMGGDLTVRSEPGRGSAFTLWLPAAAPDAAAPAPDAAPARRGLREAGSAFQALVPGVSGTVAARLRADDGVPRARDLSDAELEDHQASFLADIAQALVIVGETGGEPDLMRDGSEIQREIAARHGAQRARLGWTEDALRRELAILADEAERALRAAAVPDGVDPEPAVRLLARLVAHAEQASLRGFRAALAVTP